MSRPFNLPFLGMLLLSACSGLQDRLSMVGEKPPLTKIRNPTTLPDYAPVSMPMPPEPRVQKMPNSLWQAGSHSFFKDQRARRIGDILCVKVELNDKADLKNNTTLDRFQKSNIDHPNTPGTQALLKKILAKDIDPATMLGRGVTPAHDAKASIIRQEEIHTHIAATIVQVLSNGNFVIFGRQEFRVDRECRELLIAGIVRPEDIEPDNTIPYNRVAEARISYGGRGAMSNVQEPRYGTQILDALMPF
ncbi:MAG: flagellar basal body L-ring protein FlgH [Holosporales bacterium]|nr:flagellar basal body L-ring protein FlgH [Holosporales bacterium]